MNGPSQPELYVLSPDVGRRIEHVCNRFETAWKAEPPPRIEDYLDGWTGPERLALLRELVLLDVDYRQGRGMVWRRDEYRERFPDLDPSWLPDPAMAETLSVPEEAKPPTASFLPAQEAPTGAEGEVASPRPFGD